MLKEREDPPSAPSSLSQSNRLVLAVAIAMSAALLRVLRLSTHFVFQVKVETVTERGSHMHGEQHSGRRGSGKWAPHVSGAH